MSVNPLDNGPKLVVGQPNIAFKKTTEKPVGSGPFRRWFSKNVHTVSLSVSAMDI